MNGDPTMSSISRNQRYLLHSFEQSACRKGLDYGCGDGNLVEAAVGRGYDFWGTDPYYSKAEFRTVSEKRTPEAAKDRIRILGEDNTIPWPDETFDWVCSGQVIEHVHDLDRAVAELARVTKRGGLGLHNFPTLERIRESHNGVPYFGRIPARYRGSWARACFKVGLAYRQGLDDADEWWRGTSTWHEASVVLRPAEVVRQTFSRYFDVGDASVDKLAFHLKVDLPDIHTLRWFEARRHGTTLLMTRR
jgi:SAM-dependent methyltransferase